jgi:predicted aspartyl protease
MKKVQLKYWDMHRDVPLNKEFDTVTEGLEAMYKAKAKGHYNVRLVVNGVTVAR